MRNLQVKISVIICTHNPREDYLRQTLEALKRQSLPCDQWELVLIDNSSERPLVGQWDLSWHPHARIVREEKVGLTFARLRGIAESQAEILVFVDDDNLLDPDYLQTVIREFQGNARLGCLGAGNITPEFETSPSRELVPFCEMLAIRDTDIPMFSSLAVFTKALPYGAGLAIKRQPALDYVQSCRNSARRSALGRVGEQLLSGEDIDLALHACRIGMVAGVIPELRLVHLIPNERLKPDYLVHLARGHAISHALLARLWGYESPKQNTLLFWLRTMLMAAKQRGLARRIKVTEALATRRIRTMRSPSAV
jgi:glycosyltransferase involved in cell wall biosynthesis